MKRSFRGWFTTTVVAGSLLASGSAMAATDMFLKIDGVTGESQDVKHPGEIEVLAWSWGESAGTARTRRGPVAMACIQDLSLSKFIDSASPTLIMNTMLGSVAPTAVLVLRKAGGEQVEYLRFTMKNVSIASYQTGGSEGENRLSENVVLHFESMQGQYQKQRSDGRPDGQPITFDVSGESRGCK
jgi:type VI secretion system secreted protein Hcp